jgi:hypothetical protein
MLMTRSFGLAVTLVIASAATCAADPQKGITVIGPAGASVNIAPGQLTELSRIKISTHYMSEHGPRSASFEGPLLWSVLDEFGVLDPAKHREQVSQIILIVGRDDYRAVLAVGEIAPEFEAKQVIVADRMDGKPLDADHLRIVVPLDKRGGRSVRDVARIEVAAPTGAQ